MFWEVVGLKADIPTLRWEPDYLSAEPYKIELLDKLINELTMPGALTKNGAGDKDEFGKPFDKLKFEIAPYKGFRYFLCLGVSVAVGFYYVTY